MAREIRLRSGRKVKAGPSTSSASVSALPSSSRKLRSGTTSSATKGSKKSKSKSKPSSSGTHKPATLYQKYNVAPLQDPFILNEYLEVFSSPESGRGVRTRIPFIPAGTLLLSESPLLSLPGTTNVSTLLNAAISTLSPPSLTSFVHLTPGPPGSADSAMNRLRFNTFGDAHSYSLYPRISYINHACSPSVAMITNEDEFAEIRALVDIPVSGTQIFLDYLPALKESGSQRHFLESVKEKKKKLKEKWKFTCQCELCEKEDETNKRRKRLNELEEVLKCHFVSKEKLPSVEDLEENLEEYVGLSREEGCVESVGAAYRTAVGVWKRVEGEVAREKEMRYRTLWVEAVRTVCGSKSAEFEEVVEELGRALERRKDGGSGSGKGKGKEKEKRKARGAGAGAGAGTGAVAVLSGRIGKRSKKTKK